MNTVTFAEVESKIIEIRGQQVIIDSDVAELYGVETREVNQALSRNLEKFPEGYIFELDAQEKDELITNCDHLKKLKFSPSFPKAFTERGLYMLATILKSAKATATTLAIIDTFAQVREVSRIVNTLPTVKQDSVEQNKLMQKAGDIISELVVPDNIESEETEASIELNFAVVKFKYSVKRKSK
ncbi:MAG: ORF6N domain-containing protein [Burkholderiales bacterium]|nr:ORF6N domain-containing protein [Burkholderiales bacterium]